MKKEKIVKMRGGVREKERECERERLGRVRKIQGKRGRRRQRRKRKKDREMVGGRNIMRKGEKERERE